MSPELIEWLAAMPKNYQLSGSKEAYYNGQKQSYEMVHFILPHPIPRLISFIYVIIMEKILFVAHIWHLSAPRCLRPFIQTYLYQ